MITFAADSAEDIYFLFDLYNIARTAIPNLITKGDVDIVVRVSPEAFAAAKKALQLLYDINQPENWPNTFASFKGDENLSLPFGATSSERFRIE